MRFRGSGTGCVLVLASLFLLTACGGGGGSGSGTGTSGASGGYPVVVERNFLNACEAKAKGGICRCELSYIEARVSLHDFAVADQAIRAGTGKAPSWLVSAATSCEKQ